MITKEQDFCRDIIVYFSSLGYGVNTDNLISYVFSSYYDTWVFFIYRSFFKNFIKTDGKIYYTSDINDSNTLYNKWTRDGSYAVQAYDDYFLEHLEPFLKEHKIDKSIIKFTDQ